MASWEALVRDVPDYPKPGVVFKDITPLLSSPSGYTAAVQALLATAPEAVDAVVAAEARGFLFGAPMALALGAGLVPVRKPGKLPARSITADYDLEYGSEQLAMHADALRPGDRVLVVDDVLATGGTVAATCDLVRRLGAEVVGVSVLIELAFLSPRVFLSARGVPTVSSVLRVEAP